MRTWDRVRVALVGGVVGVGLITASTVPAGAAPVGHGGPWTGTWAASMMEPAVSWQADWGVEGFDDHTVRQVVRVSTGGVAARVRLSNAFGEEPLEIAGATIADPADGAAVDPGTLRPLTFGGARTVVIPPGEEIASDPVPVWVEPLESVAVTLYLPEPTGPATYHMMSTATSYRAAGDHATEAGGAAFAETSGAWYYLAGVEVIGEPPRRDAIAMFGDSITDGAGSTIDANNRYPDELAELLAEDKPRAVLNAGIGGNRLLTDSPCLGDSGVSRFERDVLEQPRVGTVVVLEGINDIGSSAFPPDESCLGIAPVVTAADLIEGHRELIRQAHEAGVTAVGATLPPFKGSFYDIGNREDVRSELNDWIRTSGEYDAVVDFDRVTAAPDDPKLLNPAYDSGDGLHPNDAGYRAMAAAVAATLKDL